MDDERKMWWVFTFGEGQQNAGHYVKFYGTRAQARMQMIRRFGTEWAFQYPEERYQEYARQGVATETELKTEIYSGYDLTEYNKLKRMLIEHDIPFEECIHYMRTNPHLRKFECERNQLIYPCDGTGRKSDVIIGLGSYGGQEGYLEQMGLIPEGQGDGAVQGWLTAEVVFKRWAEDFGFFVKGMEL